jgi:hypothetical protein
LIRFVPGLGERRQDSDQGGHPVTKEWQQAGALRRPEQFIRRELVLRRPEILGVVLAWQPTKATGLGR